MFLRSALAALFCVVQGGGAQAESWRFCVAANNQLHKVFVSELFASAAERAELEARLTRQLREQGETGFTPQCPLAGADRTEAINAQSEAINFNQALHYAISPLELGAGRSAAAAR